MCQYDTVDWVETCALCPEASRCEYFRRERWQRKRPYCKKKRFRLTWRQTGS